MKVIRRLFKSKIGITGALCLCAGTLYVLRTPSPIQFVKAEKNMSIVAEKGMKVAVHYQGRLEDGTVFDDSHKRGEPISFTLGKGQVIKGWDQGIEGMSVGEKRTLTIPPELGYGAQGAGDVIPPNATLIFDVELVSAMMAASLKDYDIGQFKSAKEAGAIIIDIRNEDEWQKTGIIDGAHTIQAFGPNGGVHPEFLEKFRAVIPAQDTEVILYCHSAGRSQAVGTALVEQLGYHNVAHLTGGITHWSDNQEPTVAYQ